jgi:hypothetical protein
MFVVIPVWTDQGVRAKAKPGGRPCPHMSHDGPTASCTVHDRPEYQGSPCWIYGNPDVDVDFEVKRGRPCMVGSHIQREGGLPVLQPHLLVNPIGVDELEDLGPWPDDR